MAKRQERIGFNSWVFYDDEQIQLTDADRAKLRQQANDHVADVLYPLQRRRWWHRLTRP